ncbi:MAG: VWA domain-containing protein [Verrucomicrobia bacterium]|nr:VWA domain-containing protein [Verrucomicrobiota bacterium]
MNKLRRERLEYEGAAVAVSVIFHILLFVFLINYNVGTLPVAQQRQFRFKISKVEMPMVALPPAPEPTPEEKAVAAGQVRKVGPPAVEKFAAPADTARPGVVGAQPGPMPAPAIPQQLQIGALPTRKPTSLEPAHINRDLIAMPVERPNRPMIQAPRTMAPGIEVPAPTALTEQMLASGRVGIGGTGAFTGPVTQPLTQIFGPGAKSVEQLMKEAVKPPPAKTTSALPAASLEPYVNVDVYTWHNPADAATGYYQVRIGSRADSPLRRVPKDVIFIVDVSGSIGRQRVEQFRAALRAALMQLNPEDRFNIIQFRYDIDFVSPTLMPASMASSERVQEYIARFHSMGTTDLFASTLPLAQLNRERGRLLMGVLLSDGLPTVGELDALKILHRFAQINAGRSSVFTFAGGKDVDLFLLGFLAYRNQGWLDYVAAPERIAETFTRAQLVRAYPLLLDCQFRFSGVNEEEIFPRTLPHFFRDTPLVLYGRYQRGQDKRLAVQIRAENAEGHPMDMTVVRDLPVADNGTCNIAMDWARQKISHLIARWIDTGNKVFHEQAVALGAQFRVAVPQLRK